MVSHNLEYDSAIGRYVVIPVFLQICQYASGHRVEVVRKLIDAIQNPSELGRLSTLPEHMLRHAMYHYPKRTAQTLSRYSRIANDKIGDSATDEETVPEFLLEAQQSTQRAESYPRHPNTYLPRYSHSEKDGKAAPLTGGEKLMKGIDRRNETTRTINPPYDLPKRRNRREQTVVDRLVNSEANEHNSLLVSYTTTTTAGLRRW